MLRFSYENFEGGTKSCLPRNFNNYGFFDHLRSIDINQTIETLKQEGIRCSVISLSAEIHVCRYLTTQTNGTYGAVLDDSHYRDQLLSHVDPPPAAQMQENSLIKMGFPHAKQEKVKIHRYLCACVT
ncbi:hypothetical protein DOY81_013350 [Sarcophaga bullata]|nr:hypothetical protein DOY81_013350 [Sarcophaga bullata]